MFVSVIIPTFNRSSFLDKTLHSVLSQNRHCDSFEMIVVDNGSTDDTKMIVDKYANEYSNVFYFFDSTPGLLTGRHRGAKEAKGEILSFIDDDVHVSASWLSTITAVMAQQKDIVLLTGPCLPLYEIYPPTWLEHFWVNNELGNYCVWLSLLDLGSAPKEIHPNFVWGLNFTIRKTAFFELGGFHPDNISPAYQQFQGDGETGLTLKAAGLKMKAWYHPGVMLYHQVPAARVTYDYFDKRAYYQGVCDSFTQLRTANGLYEAETREHQKNSSNILLRLTKKIYSTFRKIRPVPSNQSAPVSETVQLAIDRFNHKTKEGYHFHQNAYNNNPLVKEWVLRRNYFDYKLPQS